MMFSRVFGGSCGGGVLVLIACTATANAPGGEFGFPSSPTDAKASSAGDPWISAQLR